MPTRCADRDTISNRGITCLRAFPRQPVNWCDDCRERFTDRHGLAAFDALPKGSAR